MDKVKLYKDIVRSVIQEIADYEAGSQYLGDIQTQMIIDDERGHYLPYSVGWTDRSRTYGAFIHLDVTEDGKVWLQHDGTNLVVADDLLAKGIPKEDIVLAFHSPSRRALTGFAVS
jgi:hypothetical protein